MGHYHASTGDATVTILVCVGFFPKGPQGVQLTGNTLCSYSQEGDLSPNGSCFVIQHVSHLVNSNFLSLPDTPWKIWISSNLGRNPGVSC